MSEKGPIRKRKRLNEALAEAIGVQKQQENIEKPIALALISDEKSAKNLLEKIQANHRPKDVLELTLKICKEKKNDAVVGESFLEVFGRYFSILGIDSATYCWKIIAENLRNSQSSNEIRICCEFINKSNILGHGFGKLIEMIKLDLPGIIQKFWEDDRQVDSFNLSYTFICLIKAENAYRDEKINSVSPGILWNSQVLTKGMQKSAKMAILTVLANENQTEKWVLKALSKNLGELQNCEMIVFNHLEFFANVLSPEIFDDVFYKLLLKLLEENDLNKLAKRISNVEICIAETVWRVVSRISAEILKASDSVLSIISNRDQGFESYKDLLKLLETDQTSEKLIFDSKIGNLLKFLVKVSGMFCEKTDLAAILVVVLSISQKMSIPMELFEEVMGIYLRKKNSEKFVKKIEKCGVDLGFLRNGENEEKYVNRNMEEVRCKLENPQTGILEAIEILKGVHTYEVKKGIYDSVVKFVENIDGARSIADLRFYKILIEMYGGSDLESLCVQLVMSRLAVDEWAERMRLRSSDVVELNNDTGDFAQDPSSSVSIEETWFDIICHFTDVLETILRLASNTITGNYTSPFCQMYGQLIRNCQKFVKFTENLVIWKTFDEDRNENRVLKRHKVQHDLARIADGMKRKEGYFSMLTSSIIADTIFHGSLTLLTMARLHSVADRNAQALLATNLPVVERTRYKKFLPILTKAAKRVY